MKKNFFQNVQKLSKSLHKSASKIFPKYQSKNSDQWSFGNKQSQNQYDPFSKIKKIFSQNSTSKPNNPLGKLKQQLNNLASKQNQALFESYKNKMKQTTEQSKKVYDKKANEIKAKLESTLKQAKISLNQQHLELLKKRSSQAGQIFSEKASYLKENIAKKTEEIGKKSEKIPEKLGAIGKISGKVYEEIKQKVDVKKNVERTFSYIFWRAALLLGIIAFAYGLGTSLPRELRSVIKEIYNNDSKQASQISNGEATVGKAFRSQQGK